MKRSYFLAAALASCLLVANFSARADEIQDAGKLLRDRQFAEALSKVDGYLAHKPKDPQGRFLKGVILTEENRINEAIKVFSDLSEDYPELPEPYNNLAVLYAAQGQYDKAKNSLESAIRTHPSYATAHENLGDIYAKMASQAYDKALALDKGNAKVQTKLELIKDLFSVSRGSRPVKLARAEAAKPKAEPVVEPAKPKSEPVIEAAAQVAPSSEPVAKATLDPAAQQVVDTLHAWAKAWSSQNFMSYLAFYAETFTPEGMDLAAWKAQRQSRIEKPKSIEVTLSEEAVTFVDPEHVSVRFRQAYHASNHRDFGYKLVTLVKSDGKWLIESEKSER